MILSMTGQAWLFLSAVLTGAAIGLLYDVFRIFRRTARHSGFAVQLEDFFFWVAATGLTFYYMLRVNYGEIRPFYILGVAIGAVLYFVTVSRFVIMVFVAVINYMKRVVLVAVRVVLVPVRLVAGWVVPPVRKVLGVAGMYTRRVKRYGKRRIKKTARELAVLRRKV